ncbi:conserved hypothetical protein [Lausannevirus]|uniref:Uncharacterized protein n=1 Tax=Lausannevirus TaxID=999883 RepID=F2WKX0_9VIRU|nr:hypothetical protein LAU_0037 [Lausannevirus]AEA06893.1 conserved hypothetical protein [Lausannevirus]
MDDGIIYLLRDDFIWKEGVYKIGKSSSWKIRKSSYGDVRVLATFETDFISLAETAMIKNFRESFQIAKGREYFLCEQEDVVLNLFLSVKDEVEKEKDENLRNRYASLLPFRPAEPSSPKPLIEDTKFLQKKIDFEGAKKTCESASLDREKFSFLCSKRDKSENEIASCRKFMVAHSFEVEQETLTPEFVLEYSGKEKIFQNQRLAFAGSKAEQKERLTRAVEKKTQNKRFTKFEKRLGMSCNLERVVYARRLFYWLGYGSTTTREKKSKEEMSMRLEKIRKMVKKSKHFQTLLGKMPDDEQYMVRWINDILRRMFDCYIAKTSRGKSFSWELMFLSPWKHNGETTPLSKKRIKTPEVYPSPF